MKAETALMLRQVFVLIISFIVVGALGGADDYGRDDFPIDFVFGSGTTAYQVEGAANEEGRTPSIWDAFANAGYVHGEDGDVACDAYHKYKEDVKLMVETGIDAYRFSISWSRLLPNGRGPVNPKGSEYYNNLINELISNGIQPHVTLHNFDLPQVLEDEYGGWVSREIIRDFTYYADVCFREFGDRVKYWTTVNEPNVFALGGYDQGNSPPQRCSPPFCAFKRTRGNSTYEPYLAVHHILLAHSSAARLYRRKYKEKQHGFVGISIYTFGFFPQTNTEKDRVASQRIRDFLIGWIMEPLQYGDYPISMKTNAGDRIPAFTNRESEQVKGSHDFIGIIHYTNVNVTDNSDALKNQLRDLTADMAARMFVQDLFSNEEYPVEPKGLLQELNKFKLLYGNPPIFIHENGQRTASNSSLQDVSRVKYLHGYIGGVLDALRDGSNIKGYFAWSFLDLFELLDGYKSSFGLYYVDREDPELKRYPKLSAKWYSQFLKSRCISKVGTIELEKDPSLVSVGHLFDYLSNTFPDRYSREDFPLDFVFGSGASAYQVEGAAKEEGRSPSIWDTYANAGHAYGENGDIACDQYHKYKEDVQLMVETGIDAYRFSISWSRLLPNGRGPVNPKGLEYYNNLINELISNGIQPHVTLYNFDLPQVLEDEYGGWISRDIIRDFTYYADVCFREFGDRVLYWTTVNEPNVFARGGYDEGNSPPQRCSPPFCATKSAKGEGNSTYEPYLAFHHILLAHSSASRLYRRKYKEKQHGFVGISVFTFGFMPLTNSEKDREAAQRARDFFIGWIMEPLQYGDYPISMKTNAGDRIPAFTNRESEQVKGSHDFIGIIHYTNVNVTDNSDALNTKLRDINADMAAKIVRQDLFSIEEYPVSPWGLKQELNKFKLLYGNPPIFIYENGQRTRSNSSLQDVSRVKYLHGYIGGVLDALRDGSNIKGYFAWSFMDLFELLTGFRASFGLYYVDREDPELKRYQKLSAKWYSQFLKGKSTSIVGSGTIELEKDPSLVSVGHLFE